MRKPIGCDQIFNYIFIHFKSIIYLLQFIPADVRLNVDYTINLFINSKDIIDTLRTILLTIQTRKHQLRTDGNRDAFDAKLPKLRGGARQEFNLNVATLKMSHVTCRRTWRRVTSRRDDVRGLANKQFCCSISEVDFNNGIRVWGVKSQLTYYLPIRLIQPSYNNLPNSLLDLMCLTFDMRFIVYERNFTELDTYFSAFRSRFTYWQFYLEDLRS